MAKETLYQKTLKLYEFVCSLEHCGNLECMSYVWFGERKLVPEAGFWSNRSFRGRVGFRVLVVNSKI